MIAFTLCSNNYLAKARILAESIREHNPGIRFIIGLVDKLDDRVDYDVIGASEVVPIQSVDIPDFEGMILRYDIIDLNTAAKPFYFRYLFEKFASEDGLTICYFDPDICIYGDLQPIKEALDRASVVLTPHALTPINSDGKHPGEHTFLAFGLYNLGFCGLRRGQVADRLIEWWSRHLVKDCRYDPINGLFVDQAWMDLVPIFFDDVEVSRHPGFNVAYWNLHERNLKFRDGRWVINDQSPLVFFHFSDLASKESGAITRKTTRFTLDDRPEMKPLFQEYHSKLTTFETMGARDIPCAFVVSRSEALLREHQSYCRKHPLRGLIARLKGSMPKQLKAVIRTLFGLHGAETHRP